MPKIRRSHQPIDWQNKTQVRSGSSVLKGKQTFSLSEVTPEHQLRKMYRRRNKTERQIQRMREELHSSTTSEDRKKDLAKLILKREDAYYDATTKILIKERQVTTNQRRQLSKKENLRAEMAQARKNSEKIVPRVEFPNDPGRKAFHPETQKQIDSVFPKQRIETVGGKRKVKIAKKKTWSLK